MCIRDRRHGRRGQPDHQGHHRQHRTRLGQHARHQHRAGQAHQQRDQRWRHHPGHQVAHGVGVVDQPAQVVVAPRAPGPRRAVPDQRPPQPHPQLAGLPEGRVVGDQPLQVPQHPLGQPEGAHTHHGHGQGEDRRLLRGPGDQPPGRGGQRDAAGQGGGSEHNADQRQPGGSGQPGERPARPLPEQSDTRPPRQPTRGPAPRTRRPRFAVRVRHWHRRRHRHWHR